MKVYVCMYVCVSIYSTGELLDERKPNHIRNGDFDPDQELDDFELGA
jgi:hypothetical protein